MQQPTGHGEWQATMQWQINAIMQVPSRCIYGEDLQSEGQEMPNSYNHRYTQLPLQRGN